MVPPGPPPLAFLGLLLVWGLLVPGAPGQKFPVRVEPPELVVPAGGSLVVNCSSECPEPVNFSLETPFSKDTLGKGRGWATFRLSNVTSDHKLLCSSYCLGSQEAGAANVTVFAFPDRVDLAPLPPWLPVGDNFTLSCRVTGGTPRANLVVVLLRGKEELHRQQLAEEGVTVVVEASRKDHGVNFSCLTELDLRPHGLGVFQNLSAPQQLRTFVLPSTPPELFVPRLLEVGTLDLVGCILDGLFPASEAELQLALGGQWLSPAVWKHGDHLRASAEVTALDGQEGTLEVLCRVTLAGRNLETRVNTTIYSFWGPNLTLSELSALEGTTINVTCAAGPQVQVFLDGVPAAAPGQPAWLQIHTTEEDDGRLILCNATLDVGGELLHRNRSVQLRVLYGPTIDPAQCPPRVTWKDKTTNVLHCQARGNPDPKLGCFQEVSGREVPIGAPFFVNMSYNGTYFCRATNLLGTYNLKVVMDVQDRNLSSVTTVLVIFVLLGLLVLTASSLYVFCFHRHTDSYQVMPLMSREPKEAARDVAS
ncbi:intercellular adhesion molecule 3 [Erinaceus europaeus]|uniref:Intercellular adhesion molecule 3 n=1 Tax=Erinaceus europaeus TaxID=9365 RepID=A0ABM3WM99_ERIEU|nr:intercellular adhesion molecule 3 [Erinaceus europaeus]